MLVKLLNSGGLRSINFVKVVTNEVWKYSGEQKIWEQQLPLRQQRQFHSTVVINDDIYHVGGCKNAPCKKDRFRFEKSLILKRLQIRVNAVFKMMFELFSLERWSRQSDYMQYMDTVTLEISYEHTLLPLSPYLQKFLNSTSIGLTESFGKESITIQTTAISTGKG